MKSLTSSFQSPQKAPWQPQYPSKGNRSECTNLGRVKTTSCYNALRWGWQRNNEPNHALGLRILEQKTKGANCLVKRNQPSQSPPIHEENWTRGTLYGSHSLIQMDLRAVSAQRKNFGSPFQIMEVTHASFHFILWYWDDPQISSVPNAAWISHWRASSSSRFLSLVTFHSYNCERQLRILECFCSKDWQMYWVGCAVKTRSPVWFFKASKISTGVLSSCFAKQQKVSSISNSVTALFSFPISHFLACWTWPQCVQFALLLPSLLG